MPENIFDTYVMVDWSARSSPSSEGYTEDAICWAAARDGVVELAYARTRHDAVERLACLISKELDADRRVLIGFDFPFGYPAGVAKHLTGEDSAFALWDWLKLHICDNSKNKNNRFEVAAKINETYPGTGPFWGRPKEQNYPNVPTNASDRTNEKGHPCEWRIADHKAKGAKSVWQLFYAGSVGSQTLLGIPALKRLVEHSLLKERRLAVWPFDTGLCVPEVPEGEGSAVICEIYPSLLRIEIEKRQNVGEILDAAQVRVNAEAFAWLDALGRLGPLFEGAPYLNLDERRIVRTEEGWILGLGHEAMNRC